MFAPLTRQYEGIEVSFCLARVRKRRRDEKRFLRKSYELLSRTFLLPVQYPPGRTDAEFEIQV